MDILDIFILGVGFISFLEAVKRLYMIKKAVSFKSSILNIETIGTPEESTSFQLRSQPLFLKTWKSSRWSSLNDRPILLVLVIAIMLGFFIELLVLAMTNSKFGVLLMAIVVAIAFHNGSDDLNIDEFFLPKITKRKPSSLTGHDVRFIEMASSNFGRWSLIQAITGLLFSSLIFIPSEFLFPVFLTLVGLCFLYLGYKYSADRVIFR